MVFILRHKEFFWVNILDKYHCYQKDIVLNKKILHKLISAQYQDSRQHQLQESFVTHWFKNLWQNLLIIQLSLMSKPTCYLSGLTIYQTCIKPIFEFINLLFFFKPFSLVRYQLTFHFYFDQLLIFIFIINIQFFRIKSA